MQTVESPSNGSRQRITLPAAAAFGLAVVLLWASCGGAPKMHYYTLQAPTGQAPSDPRTNSVLGVERFRGSDIMQDDRIVYYQSPIQLNFYQQHRWSADPTAMLAEQCQRWLQQTGAFAQVRLAPYREPVDYTLRGRVLNFEEVDDPTGVKGRVGLELTLVRSRDRQVVFFGRRQAEAVAQEPGVAGVVSALNSATRQLLDEMMPGLVSDVERDYRETSDKTTK
jgi:ABC-type uncharacterized transport system auxiliary subunit